MRIPANHGNHYQSRQSGMLEAYNRPRCGSLNPAPYDNDNQFEVLQRGKSAPPSLSTTLNDFAPLPGQKVPAILVTEPDPPRMDSLSHPTVDSNFPIWWDSMAIEDSPYGFHVGNNPNLTGHEHNTVAFQSGGYGGIGPFVCNMRFR